uniref:Uncharacterized protein n=1 Tax=Arundo donax TaxID=35708 RepID=A0A0A9G607_ARUDO
MDLVLPLLTASVPPGMPKVCWWMKFPNT